MVERTTDSERLVKFGFIKSGNKGDYRLDKKKGYYVPADHEEGQPSYDPQHADEEMDEEVNLSAVDQYLKTGFPKTIKRYRLVFESPNMSIEELYFWSLNHIRQDQGFPHVLKITDVFSASENSAFFGQSAQRLSIQEDRASSFLRGISELVKTLFQIVRELRIIDERLEIYKAWGKSKSADSTLKGIFADFAENKGGQMQPGSIYHLSNQVGYAVLGDLFFNTAVYDKGKIDKIVDSLQFNPNVKSVLKRKLFQFIVWKEKTHTELEARRKFQIKYLRQHYLVIKAYMSWVKPYLKHIKRLTMNEQQLDSPDLISAFETSSTEIEVLAYKPIAKSSYHAVVLMTFNFNTKPMMNYRQEYQQGAIHIGKGTMTLRAYGWTKQQIDMYKAMKDTEDRELLGLVDDQLQAAMDMLGGDLDKYIQEAEGTLPEEDEKPKKKEKLVPVVSQSSAFDPFLAIFKAFGEIGQAFVPSGTFTKKESPKSSGDSKAAAKAASKAMWMVYVNYKKAHGMLTW